MRRIIVAISGGKSSAWCANWAIEKYGRDNVILYFNDTKWEHPDLYRFLDDLSNYLDKGITYDSDGRNPEQLFIDNRALANNRMPFCSRILKAKRLQKYYKDGDILVFGIAINEIERGRRIVGIYQTVSVKTGKKCKIKLPLITERIMPEDIDKFLQTIGIKEPLLYELGFSHNNCSGGCVRAGKKQWKRLYETLPKVYLDRERVENEMRVRVNKDIHFFKDETLEAFRLRIENKELSHYYDIKNENITTECIGICDSME